MTKDGSISKLSPHKPCFSTCKLTLYITIVRLIFIFGFLPVEFSFLLDMPAVQSIVVRYRSTLRYLQVASSFCALFPSLSQAYIASSLPPPILVWSFFSILEKWWSPMPENWRRILWRLTLLFVDYAIARLLERIATSSLAKEKETNEQELQSNMPEAIQPPRAHVFEIVSPSTDDVKENDDDALPPLLSTTEIPLLAASIYYASPITMLASGMYDSFQNVPVFLVLWSVYQIMFCVAETKPNSVLAAVSLAFATYLQPWSMVFIVPICMSRSSSKSPSVFASLFCLSLAWLQLLSFLLVGTEAYFTFKPMQQLTPNLGPRWYFQMQLFDRFHDYFATLFTGLPYLVVIPLTIRLYRYPIALVTCLVFIGALFHDNPTLFDLNVAISLLVMSPRSMARMNVVSLIAVCSIAVPLLLYILDYKLWLETGSGNANYIYFQCLAYNAFVAILFLDFVGASLQRDKALRMTAKQQDGG